MSVSARVDGIVDSSTGVVERKFDAAIKYTADMYKVVTDILLQLEKALTALKTQDADVEIDDVNDPPAFDDLKQEIPNIADVEVKVNDILSALDEFETPDDPAFITVDPVSIETVPGFTDTPPVYNPPTEPAVFSDNTDLTLDQMNKPVLPTEPTAFTETVDLTMLPLDRPTLPTEPAVFSETAPTVTYPTIGPPPIFTVDPFIDELDELGLDFDYDKKRIDWSSTDDPEYTSTLFVNLQNWYNAALTTGGTGMPQNVQEAEYARDVVRATQAKADSIDSVIQVWSKRGFDLPTGDIEKKVLSTELEWMNARIDKSNAILVEVWKLEQANIHKAVEVGTVFEGKAMDYLNNIRNRALQAVVENFNIAIKIVNTEVSKLNIKLEEFKTKIAIWDTKVKAGFYKLQAYTSEVEAAKGFATVEGLKADIYGKKVAAYSATVGAYGETVKAALNKFEYEKTKLEEVELRAKVYATKASVYNTVVGAYAETIKAKLAEFEFEKYKIEELKIKVEAMVARAQVKTAEYGLFDAKVRGEEAKQRAFALQVETYKAQLSGIATKYSVMVENMKSKLMYNDEQLKHYLGEADIFKSKLAVGLSKAETGMKAMTVEAATFDSIAKAYEVLGSLDAKVYDANVQKAIAEAQVKLRNAEIEIGNYERTKTMILGTLSEIGKLAAQIMASSLTSVSAQASIAAEGRADLEYHYSENHNYDDTTI